MALSWVLLVVVFALHNGFSEANNTTTTPSATPTTSLVPSTTESTPTTTSTTATASPTAPSTTSTTAAASQTAAATTPATTAVNPSPSTTSPPDFNTYLKVSFKSSECTAANDTLQLLNSTFKTLYDDAVFNLMDISVKRDKCQLNFTVTFGPNLQAYNISEVLIYKLISLSSTADTLKLNDFKTELYVPAHGVTLGHFEVRDDDCNEKCCDGAGGPINLYRKCTPFKPAECKTFALEMTVGDCLKVCLKKCSGVMCKISLLVLFFGVFLNWFLK